MCITISTSDTEFDFRSLIIEGIEAMILGPANVFAAWKLIEAIAALSNAAV